MNEPFAPVWHRGVKISFKQSSRALNQQKQPKVAAEFTVNGERRHTSEMNTKHLAETRAMERIDHILEGSDAAERFLTMKLT